MNKSHSSGVVNVRLLYLHCVLFKVLELMLDFGPDCETGADFIF